MRDAHTALGCTNATRSERPATFSAMFAHQPISRVPVIRRVFGSLCLLALLSGASCSGSGESSEKKADRASTTAKKATTSTSKPKSKKTGGYKGVGATAAARVTITDGYFVPNIVQVAPGGSVIFVNNEDVAHTVTPDEEGAFKAVTAEQMKAAPTGVRVTFSKEGKFAYHCELTGSPGGKYSGTVIVAEPSVPSTTASAADDATTAPSTTAPSTTAPSTTAKN